MTLKLDRIEVVTEFNHLQIREVDEQGNFVRKILSPEMDVSGEDEKIQEQAEKLWTDEVKEKWATKQAEPEASRAAESE